MAKKKKKILSIEDKRTQKKYQLKVGIICFSITAFITLFIYIINLF